MQAFILTHVENKAESTNIIYNRKKEKSIIGNISLLGPSFNTSDNPWFSQS